MSEDHPEIPGIEELVKQGEGQKLEFKSSLRWDTKLNKVNKELTKTVAKTVAGLLNAHGGTLLIGIADQGEFVGIEPDIASLTKKSRDGFELNLRDNLKSFLGLGIGPDIGLEFIDHKGKTVAKVNCPRAVKAVFFQDGDRTELYVREGNKTQPYDIQSAYEYIRTHFAPEPTVTQDTVKALDKFKELVEAIEIGRLRSALGIAPSELPRGEQIPPWIRVGTRRVLNLYLKTLADSPGWKRIFIISPWLSVFDEPASLKFDQFLERLVKDHTTAYVVTRPPENASHQEAVNLIRETRRANIVLVPNLHSKLYIAQTHTGAFALLASANFTHKSLLNREIGILVNSYSSGRSVFKELHHEAVQLYQSSPGRTKLCSAEF